MAYKDYYKDYIGLDYIDHTDYTSDDKGYVHTTKTTSYPETYVYPHGPRYEYLTPKEMNICGTLYIKKDVDSITKVIQSGPATIVFFEDGEKVVVKRNVDDIPDVYAAVAFAYMKKIFGSNSHFKKVVEKAVVQQKPKEKKLKINGDAEVAIYDELYTLEDLFDDLEKMFK